MDETTKSTETTVKKKVGRPSKAELAARAEAQGLPPPVSGPKYKLKAKPNWEEMETFSGEDTPDRLRIAPELLPEGMSFQWVTSTVLGQAVPQHRAEFEKKGWTPVHQEDFDGAFNGMFMAKNAPGEITVEGMVLMTRPAEFTKRAHRQNYLRAREQVNIKEQALRGGDLPGVTLDSQHPRAIQTNRITKTVERITIPQD